MVNKNLQSEIKQAATRYELRAVPLSKIEAKPVQWLIKGVLALGVTTLICSPGGVGKSSICCWIASQLTRGHLPGQYEGHPINIAYVDYGENPAEFVLQPKAQANTADLTRFHLLNFKLADGENETDVFFNYEAHGQLVEQFCRENDIKMLIIDPFWRALSGSGKTDAQDDVAKLFGWSNTQIAEKLGIAVVGIAHVRKSGGKGSELIAGSGQWHDGARAVFACAKNPENQNKVIVSNVKNNLTKLCPSYEFEFFPHVIESDNGPIETLRVGAPVKTELDANQIINLPAPTDTPATKIKQAEAKLVELFNQRASWDAAEIKNLVCETVDTKPKTVDRAANNLGITKTKKPGFQAGGIWTWDNRGNVVPMSRMGQKQP